MAPCPTGPPDPNPVPEPPLNDTGFTPQKEPPTCNDNPNAYPNICNFCKSLYNTGGMELARGCVEVLGKLCQELCIDSFGWALSSSAYLVLIIG
jgi:hypothetical protein